MNALDRYTYFEGPTKIENEKKQDDIFIANIKFALQKNCPQNLRIFNVYTVQLQDLYDTAIKELKIESFEKNYPFFLNAKKVLPLETICSILNLTKNPLLPSFYEFKNSLSYEIRKEIAACDEGVLLADALMYD